MKDKKSLRDPGAFLFVFELKKARFLGAFLKCFFYLDTTRHYFRKKMRALVGLRLYALKGFCSYKSRFSCLRFQKKRLALFPSKS